MIPWFRFVPTGFTGIVQTFGRASRTVTPGLSAYLAGPQKITLVSNQVENHEFTMRTKTEDDVFVDLVIGVQVVVKPQDSITAHFALADAPAQINTYVQHAVRYLVPTMELNELFKSQGAIGTSVKDALHKQLHGFGFTVLETLVSDIIPDRKVRDAMNEVVAADRLREASKSKADAEFIMLVRQAEAHKQRKILQGEGISGQRQAIVQGYEGAIQQMATALELSAKDVVDFTTTIQRFDMLESIGKSNNTHTVFLDHSVDTARPGGSSMSHTQQLMAANHAVAVKTVDTAEKLMPKPFTPTFRR